jgi:hypothetical protein
MKIKMPLEFSEEVVEEARARVKEFDDAWRKQITQTNWVWEIKTIRWDCHEARVPQNVSSYLCARTIEEVWAHACLKMDRANEAVEIVEIRRLHPLVEVL